MFDSDRNKVCNVLMQMALSDDAPASKAVFHAMLALAALFRAGNKTHAVRYKLAALHALMASTERGIDGESSIKHIAAGILLCTFEVSLVAMAFQNMLNIHYRYNNFPKSIRSGLAMSAARRV
jgi:hypothetical protein